MSKQKRIINFIRKKNPTRKELVRFINVNVNKRMSAEEYDSLPNNHASRAYYNVNINKWRYLGTIVVDKETKRISLPENFNGRLYTTKPLKDKDYWKAKYEALLKQYDELNEMCGDALHRLNTILEITKDN